MNVVIVGAGPAGLTAAFDLSTRRHNVTVLEADPEYVGGISRTVVYKGFRFDIGGHRFFTKNKEIAAWWARQLPFDFIAVKRQSRILYKGKYYTYPLRIKNAFANLGFLESFRCAASYLQAVIRPAAPETSFDDWVSNRFGRRLFSIFFKSYTEKVWGIPCEKISADWAKQRIKGLSLKSAIFSALLPKGGNQVIKTLATEFLYPRLGPGMLWEATRTHIEETKLGSIVMGQRVIGFNRDGDTLTSVLTESVDGKQKIWNGDHFIVSCPLQETVTLMNPPLSPESVAAACALQYRDFILVALILEGTRYFPDQWIYVHDPDVRVGRIQNFNNWSKDMVPQENMTCLGFEYFCTEGDEIWQQNDDTLRQMATVELRKIAIAENARVLDSCVVRMRRAYPVYDTGYENRIATIRKGLSSLKNLQVVGRNGMHRYNNQDHSMLTALIASRNLDGERADPWKVNGDAEYHEESSSFNSGRVAPSLVTDERVGP